MSLPGSIVQSMEDTLLDKETKQGKVAGAVGEGMGTAVAQKVRQYQEIRKRVFGSGKSVQTPDVSEQEEFSPEL